MFPGRKRIMTYTWGVLGRRKHIVVYIECILSRSKGDSLYLGCSGGEKGVIVCTLGVPGAKKR